ncbi:MAG TPA: polysaccharide biosynthesis/export family protein [Polyangia bacterium]|nr:polysaccharide biosynthesis/export family protein [Polyangia bacterium]
MTTRGLALIHLALGTAALVGCGPVAYDYSKEPDPRKAEFVLGINDAVKISVWKNPELSVDARVRPDGTITMPLIGDIKAAGRAPSALKTEITHRLQSFIRDESAIVSLAVTEVNSYRFTVSGQVEHAGVMSAKYFVTASEAMAMAGGLNRYANPHRLVLIRNDARGLRRIPLDYARIASGEHPEEDLVITSGDTLFAP